jgi:hypothetical protein
MKCLSIWLLFISFSSIAGDTLKPFTSDGCSAFPDGTFEQKQLWLTCCEKHDFDYWKGGTYGDRVKSDNNLKQCVSEAGEPEVALLMLAGVRVGGTPYLPTNFRWGYGWPYPKGYGELTLQELEQVEKLSALLNLHIPD